MVKWLVAPLVGNLDAVIAYKMARVMTTGSLFTFDAVIVNKMARIMMAGLLFTF